MPAPNINIKLDEKKLKFCEAYLSSGQDSVTKAAVAAGYQSTYGYKLLKQRDVKLYLGRRIRDTQKKLQADFNWKVEKLVKIIDVTVPDEAQTKEQIHASAAVSAISELNKMQGDYAPEKRVNINVSTDVDLSLLKELLAKHEREY